MTVPDRIWVCPPTIHIGGGQWWDRPGLASIHEFIRADLVDDLRKALEEARSALGGNVEAFKSLPQDALGVGETEEGQWAIRDEVIHYCETSRARIDAALARIDALKEK